ncbi:MAG: hypothetical protein JSV86_19040 [Gemmatimonadota bacterium]|nr:MAG: hypothetical protein JSV86_19040 [Gemmatimonadota bacterium]
MASFVSSNLDHEVRDNFVVFKVDAKLRFESAEVGHRWLFQMVFMEADPMKDDKLFGVPASLAFGDPSAGIIREYFVPSKEEIELSFEKELPAQHVDTEPGKEEVYANLEVKPLGGPEGFVPAKTRTNITEVDV